MARSETTGFALGVLAALLWSPHFHAVAEAVGGATSALVFHFYVVFWAAVACLLVLLATGRLEELSVFQRRQTSFLLLVLTGGYGFWLLRALAVERSAADPSDVHILFYSAPLALGLLSLPTREGARGRQVAALVLGFVGCIMIVARPSGAQGEAPGPGLGVGLVAVGAAACWAAFALAARPLVREEKVLPVGGALWSIGAVCLLATCLATGDNILAITRTALWTSMWLGVGTVALAFGCWLKCLSQMPPAFAAPLWYLALVFGVLPASRLAGVRPGWWTLGGVALILVAVYFGRGAGGRTEMTMSDLIRGGPARL